jgi:hypothetical protein
MDIIRWTPHAISNRSFTSVTTLGLLECNLLIEHEGFMYTLGGCLVLLVLKPSKLNL